MESLKLSKYHNEFADNISRHKEMYFQTVFISYYGVFHSPSRVKKSWKNNTLKFYISEYD